MGFPGYEDVVADSLVIANDGAYEPVSFTRTIQSRIDYGTTIVSKEAELLVQVVTCKPEDFDATWDKYTNEILSAGVSRLSTSSVRRTRMAHTAASIRWRRSNKRTQTSPKGGCVLDAVLFFGITPLIFLFFPD